IRPRPHPKWPPRAVRPGHPRRRLRGADWAGRRPRRGRVAPVHCLRDAGPCRAPPGCGHGRRRCARGARRACGRGPGRTRALRKAGSLASALLNAPQWRAARWGAALLVVAHLVGLNAWAWQERKALAAKQAAVRSTLTQTFPKVQVVVDAPVQMERELAQLRQAAGAVSARDLEPLLAAAGATLPSGRQPTGIEYAPGELRLR